LRCASSSSFQSAERNCWPSAKKAKGGKGLSNKKIEIKTANNEDSYQEKEGLVFSEKELRDIIMARVLEIFDFAVKELKKISRQKLLPAGIVLTGGGSKLPGIKELAKKEFQLPVRIGRPSLDPNFEMGPELSVAAGLILEGIELEEIPEGSSNFSQVILSKLKKIFNLFIP